MRLVLTDTTWQAVALSRDLGGHGFRVSSADSADALMAHVATGRPDAVLLAGDLAEMPLPAALRAVRRQAPLCPVVVLATVRPKALSALYAAGADAVLPSGIAPEELAARLRAMVLRCAGHAAPVLNVGPVAIDLAARRVTVHGRAVQLRRAEFDLLEALVLARGAPLSRDAALDKLYGLEEAPCQQIVTVYASQIRRKLQAAGAPAGLLRCLSGRGYVFDGAGVLAPLDEARAA